jgi:glutamyl-tRNA reductase
VIFVSNRTYEKAKEFAHAVGGRAVRLDNLKELLKKADIVISATASPHFIIKKETLKDALSRKLFMIDLALPRDIDPEIRGLENIDLFCLEDLNAVIERNTSKRLRETEKAIRIIGIEAKEAWKKITESEHEPALSR